ncbi:MAG: hypothetical protein KTR32_00535 [Granulosicoccus sp.]|nr:hypothetical protein [Granulosicoccus sp.]
MTQLQVEAVGDWEPGLGVGLLPPDAGSSLLLLPESEQATTSSVNSATTAKARGF